MYFGGSMRYINPNEETMYSFFQTKTNDSKADFSNLMSAIAHHDELFLMSSLSDNPEFIKQRDEDGYTPLMYGANFGCPITMFSLLLEKSYAVGADDYGQIQNTLEKHGRTKLLRSLKEFMQINSANNEELPADGAVSHSPK
ncbi:hypothetical protein Lgra_2846 [Legionella gratiana]|uniref:Ankyrin repeat protein n=2 Tax=Legionella gratiana TaxID=45066 RepID=A0A378J787_9GAMM|nr:hypothetical protein Lgra_2846 [Legionella gratiana]STX42777.1 Uncharacterised protein [Legionella gratiana]